MDDAEHSERLRRAELNEQAFQEHNERRRVIEGASGDGDLVPLICECDDPECFRPLLISVDEYARAIGPANHFVVIPGHDDLEVERVVEANPEYLVVEKPGVVRPGRES